MGRGEAVPLIRSSHIFASTIREVLELGVLKDAGVSMLSPSQFRVLKLLSLNGSYQLSRVAAFLGVSGPAATKTVDKLERLGFVVRSSLAGDRRVVLLSLSAAGRRLVRDCDERQEGLIVRALEGYDEGEVGAFADLLERFSVSILECAGPVDGPCLRCASYIRQDCGIRFLHGACAYHESAGRSVVGRKRKVSKTGVRKGLRTAGRAEVRQASGPNPGSRR